MENGVGVPRELHEAWLEGYVFQDYWLAARQEQSPRYLPSLRYWPMLQSKQPIWYVGSLALGAYKTGRLRISVDPGFALLQMSGQSTAADPGDNGGAAQMTMYDPARRLNFSQKPVVQNLILGSGPRPFRFRDPYIWTGTQPVLFIITNRVNVANTVSIVLHGRRNPILPGNYWG